MNIEQLKLILDTVNSAGEGAYTLGVLWLIQPYFTFLVGWIFGTVFFILGLKTTKTIISHFGYTNSIRDIANCYGSWRTDTIRKSEYMDIVELIEKGKKTT
jgi:hypothetical protein